MEGLRELRKHLEGIRSTEQLAGAMKTASAAKLTRLSRELDRFSAYADACRSIRDRFGSALGEVWPALNPKAPRCVVLIGANRGLSGGYNGELYAYLDRILAEGGEYLLVAAGRHAIARMKERGIPLAAEFALPDTASFEEAAPILDFVLGLWREGKISDVELVAQRFVNTLTQIPGRSVLLPMKSEGGGGSGEVLFLPDRETALKSAVEVCLRADYYGRVLEALAGCQAATLAAMRTACDNARESAAELETEISRKRQSEVTSGVLETSGSGARRGDGGRGGSQ